MKNRAKSYKLAIAAEQNVKEKEYWQKKLSGDLVKINFPYDYHRQYKGDKHDAGQSVNQLETFRFPQNLYAETMVRILGFHETGRGAFDEGKKVVESVLLDFGIEPDTYSFKDGSGLSRYNYISPKQIVKILKGMKKNPYWEIWYDIQPIAGVDGTLKYRMRGTKAEGNVRAKTGTISNVRGLSGYVTTSEGEDIVFSFLVNGHLRSSRDTNLITDKVLEVISEYPIIKDEFSLN